MPPARRRLLIVLAAAVLVPAAIALLPSLSPGPTFQWRGRSSWFPRWYFEFRWSEASQIQDCRTLAAAGPAALPMLISAAGVRDHPVYVLYESLRQRLPSALTHLVLPRHRDAALVRASVFRALEPMLAREDSLRALVNRWAEFPEDIRLDLIRRFDRRNEFPALSEGVLLAELGAANAELADAAAIVLTGCPAMRGPRQRDIVARLAAMPDARFDGPEPAPCDVISLRLAELGPDAVAAAAWLERWLQSDSPRLRACAVFTLPAVAPDRYPFAKTIRAALADPRALAVHRMLTPERIRRTRERLPWAELVPVMTPYLDPARARTVLQVVQPAPAAAPRPGNEFPSMQELETHGFTQRILEFLKELGPAAAPAIPAILPLLDDPWHEHTAATVLACIGPVAPESVARLAPFLWSSASAPALTLLMAAYGPAAQPATRQLEELARGDRELRLPGSNDTLQPMAAWLIAPDRSARGQRSTYTPVSSNHAVTLKLAQECGLTNHWPAPPSPGQTVNPPDRYYPSVRLDRMATEALRCIRGDEHQ